MIDDINSRWTERSKTTNQFYKYGTIKSHLDKLQEKTDKCTTLILDAKEMHVTWA